jgi:hypothetical protein
LQLTNEPFQADLLKRLQTGLRNLLFTQKNVYAFLRSPSALAAPVRLQKQAFLAHCDPSSNDVTGGRYRPHGRGGAYES